MEKKYQVFVSSTYKDLVEERKEVIQALLELDCIPVGMEMFPAADDDQWTLIKRLIDDCDYYVLIIGNRYGSLNSEGISYTQMEYEYALKTDIPIISFLHKTPEDISVGKSDTEQNLVAKLKEFRKLAEKKMCKYWQNHSDLGSQVSRSLVKLIKDKPRTGWVKGSFVPTEDTNKEILDLKRQIDNLNSQLTQYRNQISADTDNLASGENTVEIIYQINLTNKDRSRTDAWLNFDQETYKTESFNIEVTWDQIFKIISPCMIDEANEETLQTYLTDYLREKNKDNEGTSISNSTHKFVIGSYIESNSFHKIIVQFKALGYIQKSVKKRSIKDTGTYWQLSVLGDNIMTKLIAIKKV